MDTTSSGMRPHDWAFFVELGAGILALTALFRGHVFWALVWAALAVAAGVAARRWSLTHRGPMPHSISWTLFLPRGPHSPRNLQRILQPRPGERMLEIGPGIGIHSLPIASALRPDGVLDVLDVQQAMRCLDQFAAAIVPFTADGLISFHGFCAKPQSRIAGVGHARSPLHAD